MKIGNIVPNELKNISNTELRNFHYGVHQLFGKKGTNRERIINEHLWIVQEFEKRKLKHNIVSDLDRQSKSLRKDKKSSLIEVTEIDKNKKLELLKGFLLKYIRGKKVLLTEYQLEIFEILHNLKYNIFAITSDKEKISPKVYLSTQQNTPFKDSNFNTVIGYKIITNDITDKEIIYEMSRIGDRCIFIIDLDDGYFNDIEIVKKYFNNLVSNYQLMSIGINQFAVLVDRERTQTQSEIFNNLQNFILIPNFVQLVGSAVNTENPKSIDILFRQDFEDLNLELKFAKQFPKEIRDKLRFIYNADGASSDYIPLAHLAPIKKKEFKKEIVELTENLRVGKWFKPLKTRGGIDKLEFFDKESCWNNWACSIISKGIVIEPSFNGYRVQLHKKGRDATLMIDGVDILIKMPNIKYEVLSMKEHTLVLDGILMAYENEVPMSKEELEIYIANEDLSNEKIKIQFFDCLRYNELNLTNKQWAMRTSYLGTTFTKNYKYMTRVGNKIARRKSELFEAIDIIKHIPGSDGAILKLLDSLYFTNGKTSNWAKFKITHEINTRVKDIIYTKNKNIYNYEVEIVDEKDNSITMGKTMDTSIQAKKGDILTVACFKIYENEDNTFKILNAMVKGLKKDKNNPDTISVAKRIVEATARRTVEEADKYAYKMSIHHGSLTMKQGMRGKYIIQTHQQGKSIHCDLRMQVLQPERYNYLEGITLDTDGDKLLNSKYEEKIFCKLKSKQPETWMRVLGNFTSGSFNATQFSLGIFKVINKGAFICGAQEQNFHEFWFETSNKQIKGKWILENVPEGRTKRKSFNFWVFLKPKKQYMNLEND